MIVLGFHGGRRILVEDGGGDTRMHDGAAVLVEDGEILAAIEDERLNRVKHSNYFPTRAIRYCLDEAGISLDDVDRVATNLEEPLADYVARRELLLDPRVRSASARERIGRLLAEELDTDVSDKLFFCNHHRAHLWSAFVPSGFDRSLVVSLDGDGDNLSGMVAVADGGEPEVLETYGIGQSLGNFYTNMIRLLGYGRFDEYKIMGLAPYGDPEVYSGLFQRLYELEEGGQYRFASPSAQLVYLEEEGLVSEARRKGEEMTRRHMDLAAALQATLERIAFHILGYFRRETGEGNLCLAGGVAHNCSMNGKVLDSGLFDRVYVQPAAHDAGGALGAALAALHEEGAPVGPRKLPHLFFGPDLPPDDDIRTVLEAWGSFVEFERKDAIEDVTSGLLADGGVAGWVQGRSELGPRALGHRSILGDPRPAENRHVINRMIKKREGYRPFAPSVLEGRVADYFEVPEQQTEFPYMIFVMRVREEVREFLGAVTHVDGTARIHTVSKKVNPRYWRLLRAFEERTGVPILLNTSFNNDVEPIVDSPHDAITCFLTTQLPWLVVGDYLVRKRQLSATDPAWLSLVPELPPDRKLVRGPGPPGCAAYRIESTAARQLAGPAREISAEMFGALSRADGHATAGDLLADAGLGGGGRRDRIKELLHIWSRRSVVLRPAGLAREA